MHSKIKTIRSEARKTWLDISLVTLILALSLLYLLLFVLLSVMRITYPYPLAWTEGYMVDHVTRVFGPGDIYTSPSVDFLTFVYPPFYYFCCAVVSLFTGVGFLSLRLVSFISSIAVMYIIALIAHKEGGKWYLSIAAAGLYAAGYKSAGYYYDTARVDSLALGLFLSAAYIVRYHESWRATVCFAIIMCLCMFTKQTYLIPCAALAPYLFLVSWKRCMVAYATIFVLMVTFGFLLNYSSSGWFFFHAFGAASSHGLRHAKAVPFLFQHFLLVYPFLIGLALLGFVFFQRKAFMTTFFFLSFFCAMTLVAFLGRLSDGGAVNALLPGYAAFAVTGIVMFEKLLKSLKQNKHMRFFTPAFRVLIICQFLVLAYNPRNALPSHKDKMAGDSLIKQMRSFKGEVWLTMHGYLPTLAGKKSNMPYAYLDSKIMDQEKQIKDLIDSDIQNQRFDAIFFHGDLIPESWTPYYKVQRRVFESPDAFYPVCGYQIRPKILLVPKPQAYLMLGDDATE